MNTGRFLMQIQLGVFFVGLFDQCQRFFLRINKISVHIPGDEIVKSIDQADFLQTDKINAVLLVQIMQHDVLLAVSNQDDGQGQVEERRFYDAGAHAAAFDGVDKAAHHLQALALAGTGGEHKIRDLHDLSGLQKQLHALQGKSHVQHALVIVHRGEMFGPAAEHFRRQNILVDALVHSFQITEGRHAGLVQQPVGLRRIEFHKIGRYGIIRVRIGLDRAVNGLRQQLFLFKGLLHDVYHLRIGGKHGLIYVVRDLQHIIAGDDLIGKHAGLVKDGVDIFIYIIGMEIIAGKQQRHQAFEKIEIVQDAFFVGSLVKADDIFYRGVVAVQIHRGDAVVQIGEHGLRDELDAGVFLSSFDLQHGLDDFLDIDLAGDDLLVLLHMQRALRGAFRDNGRAAAHVIKAFDYLLDELAAVIIVLTHFGNAVGPDKFGVFAGGEHQGL